LNKVVNTYSINSRLLSANKKQKSLTWLGPGREAVRQQIRKRAEIRRNGIIPYWKVFLGVMGLSFLVCVTVNLRAHSEVLRENQQNEKLAIEIEQLQSANSTLSDEVNRLKTDSRTIERAARERLSMVRPEERIIISDK
jgi:cell division protein FtsB